MGAAERLAEAQVISHRAAVAAKEERPLASCKMHLIDV
eukprot:SAG31_NODE_15553_length_749_cov_1.058462_1_plen_37_part_10